MQHQMTRQTQLVRLLSTVESFSELKGSFGDDDIILSYRGIFVRVTHIGMNACTHRIQHFPPCLPVSAIDFGQKLYRQERRDAHRKWTKCHIFGRLTNATHRLHLSVPSTHYSQNARAQRTPLPFRAWCDSHPCLKHLYARAHASRQTYTQNHVQVYVL